MSTLKILNHLYSTPLWIFSRICPWSSFLYLIHHSSTVTSNSAANYHLYADYTQLLFSFSALNFSHNTTHIENTIPKSSNWMFSIFLYLILLKLSFSYLVYHKNSLNSIIHLHNNVILSLVNSARNLGVTFDMSVAQKSAVSKSCPYNIRDRRCIRNTIDKISACTIATLLSFTQKLTIVILFVSLTVMAKCFRI